MLVLFTLIVIIDIADNFTDPDIGTALPQGLRPDHTE